MEYLYIGKLVNTHGLKGEVRILSDFRYINKVFIPNMTFYIGKDKKEFTVESYRKHKNFHMVVFKGYYDINLVEYLKGSFVYINKDDLKLEENITLAIDLIGYDVIIDNKKVGVINDILDTLANEVLVLDNNSMIPYVKEFIKEIDKTNKKVVINNMKGLLE